MSDDDKNFVIDYLLGKLKNDNSELLMNTIRGIGRFLDENHVSKLIDPLLRLICDPNDSNLKTRANKYFHDEHRFTSIEIDKAIVVRLNDWIRFFTEKNNFAYVGIIEEIKSIYDVPNDDIPF